MIFYFFIGWNYRFLSSSWWRFDSNLLRFLFISYSGIIVYWRWIMRHWIKLIKIWNLLICLNRRWFLNGLFLNRICFRSSWFNCFLFWFKLTSNFSHYFLFFWSWILPRSYCFLFLSDCFLLFDCWFFFRPIFLS